MKALALLIFGALFVPGLHAGEIYKCKGKNGETVFTNLQCPDPKSTEHAGSYQPVPDDARTQLQAARSDRADRSRESVDQATASPYDSTISATYGNATDSSSGFRCQAGDRSWVQTTPCPMSSKETVKNKFRGVDTWTGNAVEGTVDQKVVVPVQQDSVTKSEFCTRLKEGSATNDSDPGRKNKRTQSDEIYERNKLKQQSGC